MIKVRSLSAVLALGALAALPGCSMFGGGEQPAPTAAAAPAPAPTPPAPPPSNPAQNAMSRSLVRQVQTELKQNHMYRGKIDGIWGPNTRRGVMEFQRKNNLNPTGQLDDQTLQAMNLGAPTGNTGNESMGGSSGGNMGGMNETGANGTNMPSAGGGMGTNTTGPGTGGTAAPPR